MTFDPRLQDQLNEHPYSLLFVTISGAHLYGFPSEDSDYDLRGAHLLPLEDVVGLKIGDETVEKSVISDGLEIDLVTHDIRNFMGLMLKKNGYVLEQLLSPLIVHTTPEHEELKAIATDCITKHHAHHYLGFAATQWKLFLKDCPNFCLGESSEANNPVLSADDKTTLDNPRVKPLLYVYRVLLTGIHLMRTGKVEANLLQLDETEKLPFISELIEQKVNGTESGTLEMVDLEFHQQQYERLRSKLAQAYEECHLPESPRGTAALNDLLVRIRLRSE